MKPKSVPEVLAGRVMVIAEGELVMLKLPASSTELISVAGVPSLKTTPPITLVHKFCNSKVLAPAFAIIICEILVGALSIALFPLSSVMVNLKFELALEVIGLKLNFVLMLPAQLKDDH